jgi:predicted  nucleic acid-binding Zn-ribbon protein
MSKTIKQSLLILGVLLLLSVGVAIVTLLQKQALEKQNTSLQGQVSDYETKDRKLAKDLTEQKTKAEKMAKDLDEQVRSRDALQKKLDDATKDSSRISDELDRLKRDKTDVDSRMANIRKERDDLLEKLKNQPEKIVEKIVYRDKPAEAAPQAPLPVAVEPSQPVTAPAPQPVAPQVVINTGDTKANEQYWAGIVKAKAALEIELTDVKKKLGESSLKIEDLKKANSDLELEVGRLKNDREEIVHKIKYGEDLADSLSVELARARNDQRSTQDRGDKILTENQSLRGDIRQLTSTKVALEKSIAKLTDEKSVIEKKLVETENIIQSRIDEIWKIKKDVDKRFDNSDRAGSGEVELAPIVVNAGSAPAKMAQEPVRKAGNIVSINEENNFVVINMGEKDNIRNGDLLKVYRDRTTIGTIAVIQVRKEISAADIKQRTTPFKPGDTVR